MLVDKFITLENLHYDVEELNRILNFLKYIKGLADNNPSGSITVAVSGDWGTGKTSYLKIAESFYKNYCGYPVVFYEAWKYQNDKDYFLSLLYEIRSLPYIGETSDKILSLMKEVSFHVGMGIVKRFLNISPEDINKSIKIYQDNIIKEYSKTREENKKLREILKMLINSYKGYNAPQEVINIGHKYIWELLDKSIEERNKSFIKDFEKETKNDGYDNNFIKRYSEILRAFKSINNYQKPKNLKPEGKKLVLIIDDLDRLVPKNAFKMIEVLRFYFDIDDVIILMGINDSVLEKYINKIFHLNDDDISDKFLEKVFQYSYRLKSSKLNNIHLRHFNDGEKDFIKNTLSDIHLPHRKWVKILNNLIDKMKSGTKLDINDIVLTMFEELYPEFDYTFRQIPYIQVKHICDNLEKLLKEEDLNSKELLEDLVSRMSEDRTFLRHPLEILKSLCNKLETKKDEVSDNI